MSFCIICLETMEVFCEFGNLYNMMVDLYPRMSHKCEGSRIDPIHTYKSLACLACDTVKKRNIGAFYI